MYDGVVHSREIARKIQSDVDYPLDRGSTPVQVVVDADQKSYLNAQFFRIESRRGPRKATLAVAVSMLTATYFMLRDGVEYRDLGHDYFDRINKAKAADRLVRRLNALGFEVELKAAA